MTDGCQDNSNRPASLRHRTQIVQRQIYFQHIHPRLTQKSQLPSRGMALDDLPHLVFAQPALRERCVGPGIQPPPA